MQFPQSLIPHHPHNHGLFSPTLLDALDSPPTPQAAPGSPIPEWFSELQLCASLHNSRHLLGPVLRELSQQQDPRWLTLIAPPDCITHNWLRSIGLNRERLLLLQAETPQHAFRLTCEALQVGRSHTVISWLKLSSRQRQTLRNNARDGMTQSLNIRLG